MLGRERCRCKKAVLRLKPEGFNLAAQATAFGAVLPGGPLIVSWKIA